jgi:hypothetical protein
VVGLVAVLRCCTYAGLSGIAVTGCGQVGESSAIFLTGKDTMSCPVVHAKGGLVFGRSSNLKRMMKACDALHRSASIIDPEVVRFDNWTVIRVRTNIDSYLLIAPDDSGWVSLPVLVDPETGEPRDGQPRLGNGLPVGSNRLPVSMKPNPGELAVAILQEVAAAWNYYLQRGPDSRGELDPHYEYAVAAQSFLQHGTL